jgi:chaperonin GroES
MSLIPLGTRVIIEPTEKESKTKGGLYIPDDAKGKSTTGKVVSYGEKVNTLKFGEKVIYAKYAGSIFEHDGTELLIIEEGDIMAKVK